jgi:hypothetical protein
MMRVIVGAAMALCTVIPGCAPGGDAPTAREAQTIHIGEGQEFPFNAQAGDVIIVTMNPAGDPIARCNDMGGEPLWNPDTNIYECDNVDF